jgi:hypothetical protein
MARKQLAIVEPEEELIDDEIEQEITEEEDLGDYRKFEVTGDEQVEHSLNDEPADDGDRPQAWEPAPPLKPLTTEQILKQIEELESFCAKAEARYLDAKSAAKAAKGDYDDAVYRMRQCIAAAANDSNRPILQMAEANAAKEPVQEVKEISDEASRTLIENLMTPTVANKLYAAGIVTVGDMVDYLDKGNQLKDLVGIGPGTAERIGLVMVEFWQEMAKQEQAAGQPQE